MIHDKIHINTLKRKYLSEYLKPEHQAYRYIYKRLSTELENELGINAMHDECVNYEYDTLKEACELCEWYRDSCVTRYRSSLIEVPGECLISYNRREDRCSLYRSSKEKYKIYHENEEKLKKSIQDTIKQDHVESYILMSVAKKKLIKYKKARKNETS